MFHAGSSGRVSFQAAFRRVLGALLSLLICLTLTPGFAFALEQKSSSSAEAHDEVRDGVDVSDSSETFDANKAGEDELSGDEAAVSLLE